MKLEELTKHYPSCILLSQQLHDLLSQGWRDYFRVVDKVCCSDTNSSTLLYAPNYDPLRLFKNGQPELLYIFTKKDCAKLKEALNYRLQMKTFNTLTYINSNPKLCTVLYKDSEQFR